MEWEPLDLVKEEDDTQPPAEKKEGPSKDGLLTPPNELHKQVLSDATHLHGALSFHEDLITTAAGPADSNAERFGDTLNFEAQIARLNGWRNEGGYVIPLHGCEPDSVKLDTATEGEGILLRLKAESRLGETLERTFSLTGENGELVANWVGGELHLRFNQENK